MSLLTSSCSSASLIHMPTASENSPPTGSINRNTGTHAGSELTYVASHKKAPNFLRRLADRIGACFHKRGYAVISQPKNSENLLVRPLRDCSDWIEISMPSDDATSAQDGETASLPHYASVMEELLSETKDEPPLSYDDCKNRVRMLLDTISKGQTEAAAKPTRKSAGNGARYTEKIKNVEAAKIALEKRCVTRRTALKEVCGEVFEQSCHENFLALRDAPGSSNSPEPSTTKLFMQAYETTCDGRLTPEQIRLLNEVLGPFTLSSNF